MSVTLEVSQSEMSSLKSVAKAKAEFILVTADVSQVEISPYTDVAAEELETHAVQAVLKLSFVIVVIADEKQILLKQIEKKKC